jgi:hypothetical protein
MYRREQTTIAMTVAPRAVPFDADWGRDHDVAAGSTCVQGLFWLKLSNDHNR